MKRSRIPASLFLFLLAPAPLAAQLPDLDSLDAYVKEQMSRRQIPGLSLAIIHSGRIAIARGYGVIDLTAGTPVTSRTLFQAGSISKPVAALGALHMVEAGTLSLDEDVNARLTSWKLPGNGFTASEKVTLRRLLSHRAGVTVHGFPGYDATDPLPTLVQVLNGAPPANTAPIRVDTTPGAIWRYSGGGFTIAQQLMVDVSGKPFPQLMQEAVLGPLGMTHSSFEQPLPANRAAATASGYYLDRTPVSGRWHLYPEMAAAGLWTTPSDLARFVIEVQETVAGRGRGVISPAMARSYLNDMKNGYGLGVAVEGNGQTLRFNHGGRDEGFDAFLYADLAGNGIVIMINANDNGRLMGRIMDHVASISGWPEEVWMWMDRPAMERTVALSADYLQRFQGYYLAGNRMVPFVLTQDQRGIAEATNGFPDETFRPIDSTMFSSVDRALHIAFALDSSGRTTALVWKPGEPGERRIARVAPLPSTLQPIPDPDTALTARSMAALRAIQQTGAALSDAADITPGAKRNFAGGIGAMLDDLGDPVFLGEENTAGRGIHRHGSPVARVRCYRVTHSNGPRYLLVHLAPDGALADFDLMEH